MRRQWEEASSYGTNQEAWIAEILSQTIDVDAKPGFQKILLPSIKAQAIKSESDIQAGHFKLRVGPDMESVTVQMNEAGVEKDQAPEKIKCVAQWNHGYPWRYREGVVV